MVAEASQTTLLGADARYPSTRNSANSQNATPPSTTVVSKMAHLARQLVAGAIEDFEAPLRSGQIVSNNSISGILTTHYYANNPHRNYITNQHERSSRNNSSTQPPTGFDDADLDDLLCSISQESGSPSSARDSAIAPSLGSNDGALSFCGHGALDDSSRISGASIGGHEVVSNALDQQQEQLNGSPLGCSLVRGPPLDASQLDGLPRAETKLNGLQPANAQLASSGFDSGNNSTTLNTQSSARVGGGIDDYDAPLRSGHLIGDTQIGAMQTIHHPANTLHRNINNPFGDIRHADHAGSIANEAINELSLSRKERAAAALAAELSYDDLSVLLHSESEATIALLLKDAQLTGSLDSSQLSAWLNILQPSGAQLGDTALEGSQLSNSQLVSSSLDESQVDRSTLDSSPRGDSLVGDAFVSNVPIGGTLGGNSLTSASGQASSAANKTPDDISWVSMQRAALHQIALGPEGDQQNGSQLSNSPLGGFQLDHSRLDSAQLGGSQVSSAQVGSVQVSSSQLDESPLRESTLDRSHFSVHLSGLQLNDAQLAGSQLNSLPLSGSPLDASPPGGSQLDGSQTRAAQLLRSAPAQLGNATALSLVALADSSLVSDSTGNNSLSKHVLGGNLLDGDSPNGDLSIGESRGYGTLNYDVFSSTLGLHGAARVGGAQTLTTRAHGSISQPLSQPLSFNALGSTLEGCSLGGDLLSSANELGSTLSIGTVDDSLKGKSLGSDVLSSANALGSTLSVRSVDDSLKGSLLGGDVLSSTNALGSSHVGSSLGESLDGSSPSSNGALNNSSLGTPTTSSESAGSCLDARTLKEGFTLNHCTSTRVGGATAPSKTTVICSQRSDELQCCSTRSDEPLAVTSAALTLSKLNGATFESAPRATLATLCSTTAVLATLGTSTLEATPLLTSTAASAASPIALSSIALSSSEARVASPNGASESSSAPETTPLVTSTAASAASPIEPSSIALSSSEARAASPNGASERTSGGSLGGPPNGNSLGDTLNDSSLSSDSALSSSAAALDTHGASTLDDAKLFSLFGSWLRSVPLTSLTAAPAVSLASPCSSMLSCDATQLAVLDGSTPRDAMASALSLAGGTLESMSRTTLTAASAALPATLCDSTGSLSSSAAALPTHIASTLDDAMLLSLFGSWLRSSMLSDDTTQLTELDGSTLRDAMTSDLSLAGGTLAASPTTLCSSPSALSSTAAALAALGASTLDDAILLSLFGSWLRSLPPASLAAASTISTFALDGNSVGNSKSQIASPDGASELDSCSALDSSPVGNSLGRSARKGASIGNRLLRRCSLNESSLDGGSLGIGSIHGGSWDTRMLDNALAVSPTVLSSISPSSSEARAASPDGASQLSSAPTAMPLVMLTVASAVSPTMLSSVSLSSLEACAASPDGASQLSSVPTAMPLVTSIAEVTPNGPSKLAAPASMPLATLAAALAVSPSTLCSIALGGSEAQTASLNGASKLAAPASTPLAKSAAVLAVSPSTLGGIALGGSEAQIASLNGASKLAAPASMPLATSAAALAVSPSTLCSIALGGSEAQIASLSGASKLAAPASMPLATSAAALVVVTSTAEITLYRMNGARVGGDTASSQQLSSRKARKLAHRIAMADLNMITLVANGIQTSLESKAWAHKHRPGDPKTSVLRCDDPASEDKRRLAIHCGGKACLGGVSMPRQSMQTYMELLNMAAPSGGARHVDSGFPKMVQTSVNDRFTDTINSATITMMMSLGAPPLSNSPLEAVQLNGSQLGNSQPDSLQLNGMACNSAQLDSLPLCRLPPGDSSFNESQLGGSQLDSSQLDGSQHDSSQVDSSLLDSVQVDGSMLNAFSPLVGSQPSLGNSALGSSLVSDSTGSNLHKGDVLEEGVSPCSLTPPCSPRSIMTISMALALADSKVLQSSQLSSVLDDSQHLLGNGTVLGDSMLDSGSMNIGSLDSGSLDDSSQAHFRSMINGLDGTVMMLNSTGPSDQQQRSDDLAVAESLLDFSSTKERALEAALASVSANENETVVRSRVGALGHALGTKRMESGSFRAIQAVLERTAERHSSDKEAYQALGAKKQAYFHYKKLINEIKSTSVARSGVGGGAGSSGSGPSAQDAEIGSQLPRLSSNHLGGVTDGMLASARRQLEHHYNAHAMLLEGACLSPFSGNSSHGDFLREGVYLSPPTRVTSNTGEQALNGSSYSNLEERNEFLDPASHLAAADLESDILGLMSSPEVISWLGSSESESASTVSGYRSGGVFGEIQPSRSL